MSVLIDKLNTQDIQEINGCWYKAKPYEPTTIKTLWRRLKDVFNVLKGKSFAYHYKIDENYE